MFCDVAVILSLGAKISVKIFGDVILSLDEAELSQDEVVLSHVEVVLSLDEKTVSLSGGGQPTIWPPADNSCRLAT
jgi:hypothetical protein